MNNKNIYINKIKKAADREKNSKGRRMVEKEKGKAEEKGQRRWGKSSFVTEDPTGNYKGPFLPSRMLHCSNSSHHSPKWAGLWYFLTRTRQEAIETATRYWKEVCSRREPRMESDSKKQRRARRRCKRRGGGQIDSGDIRQVNGGLTSWTGPGGQRSCSRCCLCSSVLSGLRESEHTGEIKTLIKCL